MKTYPLHGVEILSKISGRHVFAHYDPVERRQEALLLVDCGKSALPADRVVQQTVLYLREINDSQREQWIRAIEVFDEDADAAATKSSSSSWSFLEAQWEFGRRSLYGLPTSKTDNDSLESLQHQS